MPESSEFHLATGPAVWPILKIEGPPGSGKTRELAREVCRLIVQEGVLAENCVMLSVTPLNRQRFLEALRQEASLAGIDCPPVEALSWESWILRSLKRIDPVLAEKAALLSETSAVMLLETVIHEQILTGHVLYHASRSTSFSVAVLHWLWPRLSGRAYSGASLHQDAPGWLQPIITLFLEKLEESHLYTHAMLAVLLLEAIQKNQALLWSLFPAQAVFLVDEAQELSEVQYKILLSLPGRMILAGNEKLSIRSFRGAQPEYFSALAARAGRPVTLLPKQACMRGNEAILALLSQWLPTPIWEAAESPSLDRLAQAVQFGVYETPLQEAMALGKALVEFVEVKSTAGEKRSWKDCVVLLRSAAYKPYILEAFAQYQIPWADDTASETFLAQQNELYDLFQVLSGWQKVGLSPLKIASGLESLAEILSDELSFIELQAFCQQNNQHLRRWLESQLAKFPHADFNVMALDTAWTATSQQFEMMPSLLLFQLSDGKGMPDRLKALMQMLFELYESLQSHASLSLLLEKMKMLVEKMYWEEYEAFQASVLALEQQYQSVFSKKMPLSMLLPRFFEVWTQEKQVKQSKLDDVVRILSVHQVQGETIPWVWIPFLIEGEFPRQSQVEGFIQGEQLLGKGFSEAPPGQIQEEARLLGVGMSRSAEFLGLSAHQTEQDSPVLVSSFFKTLLLAKFNLLGTHSVCRICRCALSQTAVDWALAVDRCVCTDFKTFQSLQTRDPSIKSRYSSDGLWAGLKPMLEEPVFQLDQPLTISASSIKTYMACPRQFYYKHLLRLPQGSNEAALLGSLTHRVLERFNAQGELGNYTESVLKEFVEALFLGDEAGNTFEKAGFTENDRAMLSQISPLKRMALRQRLLESVDDLVRKGYFQRYSSPKKVLAEQEIKNVTIEGLENCQFSGKIDALIQRTNGEWDILDYKTFQSAYSTSIDTCESRFKQVLKPLPSEEGLSHAERFSEKLSTTYPQDYQLPLYFLACQQEGLGNGDLQEVAIQIVRPEMPDRLEQGAIRLVLNKEEIESSKEALLSDLQRYIVMPILASKHFSAYPTPMSCDYCSYKEVCDAEIGTTDLETVSHE